MELAIEINQPREVTAHGNHVPIRFDIDFPNRPLGRLTTAFRILVAIPILIILAALPGESFHAGGQTAGYVASGSGLLFLPRLLMIVFRRKYAVVVRLEPEPPSLHEPGHGASGFARRSISINR